MHFQWYPGHMTKARRMMQENIKLIDLVIELVDARIPLSSRNPDIDELGRQKSRLILLNKADLAENKWNDAWIEYFKDKGYLAVKVNSKKGGGIKNIQSVIQEACKEKIERDRKRGILNRPVRAMVVGIPNVGKSTFINTLAGKASAKTGNKPGVTKGKQWIRLNKSIELLDTPGILWPKFEDQMVGCGWQSSARSRMSCCRQKNSHCGCLAIREAIIRDFCRRVIRFRKKAASWSCLAALQMRVAVS